VHHVGNLYGQFMMHGQRNIKLVCTVILFNKKTYCTDSTVNEVSYGSNILRCVLG